jgi:hypothetical protein
MTIRIQQVLAGVLALSATYVGGWALLAPRSFYDDFPLPGRHWVSLAGAYDEHLVRDVGGLYLALLVVTIAAIRRTDLLRVAGLAWLVFSVPHVLFHLDHLDGLTTGDKIAQLGSLTGTVVLAALLLPTGKKG